jgi:hypothetical protein
LAQLGKVQPATTGLLQQMAETVQARVVHEHPKWEDLYCLNLTSWLGERVAPVLRRLVDAESRAGRYRIAWKLAHQRAIARGSAADRASGRLAQAQEALQQCVITILAYQMSHAQIRESTLREAVRTVRQKHQSMPQQTRERIGEGVLLAALVLDDAADCVADTTPDTDAAPLEAVLKAHIYDVLATAADTGTVPALKLAAVRQHLAATIAAGLLGEKDTRPGSQPAAGGSTPGAVPPTEGGA